jgi:quinol monooxygenase YgiN
VSTYETSPERSRSGLSGFYGLVVRFRLNRDGAEGFDRLVAETVAEIAKHEPGTLLYAVHSVDGKPDERVFYELYASEAAFEAHEGQPHTRRFLAQRGRYMDGYDVDFVAPVAVNRSL